MSRQVLNVTKPYTGSDDFAALHCRTQIAQTGSAMSFNLGLSWNMNIATPS